MDWRKIGYVKASKYRKKILLEIDKGAKTPKELSENLGLHISHVSRTLSDLERWGLVTCLTPEFRKGRLFDLTSDGKEIVARLS